MIHHLITALRILRSDAINVEKTCATPVVNFAKIRNEGSNSCLAEAADKLLGEVALLPDFWRWNILNLVKGGVSLDMWFTAWYVRMSAEQSIGQLDVTKVPQVSIALEALRRRLWTV